MGYLREVIDRLDGMRKLLLCVGLAVLAGIPLLLLGYISGAEWKEIATTAIVAYCSGNVGEHIVSAAKSYIDSKTSSS